jgi:ADP-heptose:LPS heptosyltransferase
MKSPQRILLIKPSSFGDVIHALPVVSALHRHWPEAELRWLIQPVWRSLVEGHSGVAGTILFPRDKFRGGGGWMRSVVWARLLKDWKPDLAIDLQGLLRSAIFARLSGATRIVGLSDAREGAGLLHGESARVNRLDHAVMRSLSVLDHLGIDRPARPEFELPAGTLPEGFDVGNPYIVLHPYSRGIGKSLDSRQINAFVRGVSGHRVVIVGRGESGEGLPPNAEDWSNRTNLLELIGLLRRASFIVSSDSGPMHLAAVLRPASTLAIHLWSDPLKVGPCFPESLVWKSGKISRVGQMDDSWRPSGNPPGISDMEELGEKAVREILVEGSGFPV